MQRNWPTGSRTLSSPQMRNSLLLVPMGFLQPLKYMRLKKVKKIPGGYSLTFLLMQVTFILFLKILKCMLFAKGLSSGLTHLDWNVASDKLVVNSETYELKFISLNQKREIPSSSCIDEDWNTWTCTLGWFSKGIFPINDGIDVNTCTRSRNRKVLATGDNFGRVNLFTYPVCASK